MFVKLANIRALRLHSTDWKSAQEMRGIWNCFGFKFTGNFKQTNDEKQANNALRTTGELLSHFPSKRFVFRSKTFPKERFGNGFVKPSAVFVRFTFLLFLLTDQKKKNPHTFPFKYFVWHFAALIWLKKICLKFASFALTVWRQKTTATFQIRLLGHHLILGFNWAVFNQRWITVSI